MSLTPPNLRKLRVLFVVLVLAICARAELARQILLNVQCAHGTWEPIVPLALAVWDCAVSRRRRKHDMELDEQTSTIYDVWERRIMNSPYRYLVVVAIVSFGSLGALPRVWESAIDLHMRRRTPIHMVCTIGTALRHGFGRLDSLLHQRSIVFR